MTLFVIFSMDLNELKYWDRAWIRPKSFVNSARVESVTHRNHRSPIHSSTMANFTCRLFCVRFRCLLSNKWYLYSIGLKSTWPVWVATFSPDELPLRWQCFCSFYCSVRKPNESEERSAVNRRLWLLAVVVVVTLRSCFWFFLLVHLLFTL